MVASCADAHRRPIPVSDRAHIPRKSASGTTSVINRARPPEIKPTGPADVGPINSAFVDETPSTLITEDITEEDNLAVLGVRVDNGSAMEVPVEVRIGISPRRLRWGDIRGYITAAGATAVLSETSISIGAEWARRAIVLAIPRPASVSKDVEYMVHIEGDFRVRGESADAAMTEQLQLSAASSQGIRFDPPMDCDTVEEEIIEGRACPILYEASSINLNEGKHKAANRLIISKIVHRVDELCRARTFRVLQLGGWASTLMSTDPTNEELARGREKNAVEVLRRQWPSACTQVPLGGSNQAIHINPRAHRATDRFGRGVAAQAANQCVEIRIQRHKCR